MPERAGFGGGEGGRAADGPRSPAGGRPIVILHVHDHPQPPLSRAFEIGWTAITLNIRRLATLNPGQIRHCLVDVDLADPAKREQLRTFVDGLVPGGRRIFVCPPNDKAAARAARALRATDVVIRPFSDDALLRLLSPEGVALRAMGSAACGASLVEAAFEGLLSGGPSPSAEEVGIAAETLVGDIHALGIKRWLGAVRSHHAGTYQHCLIVTGLATSFGQELGFSAADTSKLTAAALLHDVGKAKIDVAILDKPAKLTDAEIAVIRMHPVWGEEHLRSQPGFSPDVVDVVRHHHEYLDGSGYPDGLTGGQISDLTRIVTVADVFGALIEQRAYKPPMPPRDAFTILRTMASDGKLEAALVGAFGAVSARLVEQAGERTVIPMSSGAIAAGG